MPIYDKVLLSEKAKSFGFNSHSFEKVSRLVDILRFINETPELHDSLALKGGTAINLTVFNLPRLSVDIDLDFTKPLSRDETRKKRNRINNVLGRYMASQGYVQRDKSRQTHILDSHVYSYTNAAGNTDNIKVETNYSLRCHLLPTKEVRMQNSGAFEEVLVRTLNPIEIFASKIVALLGRVAARDLYDLNNMVFFGLFDETDLILLRKCAVFYLAIAGDIGTQGFQFKRVQEITDYKIKTDLYPMIRNTERFNLKEAQKRLSDFFEENLTLSKDEKTFLKYFSNGAYKPQLLFDDAEILERIQGHPMAEWRVRQIRERNER